MTLTCCFHEGLVHMGLSTMLQQQGHHGLMPI
eukprot:CAMPEP_0202895964 /NCGR_PEP_ID=MMETSP1392-20130828/5065_1 /ASSEMBLY_ACC=CAM_ASM_000868 /TAXON_ID=225041 /ORGANISM="Chlamydomonas chlamydogama, Strain SAG 11-48b" /LENGTH=31 /DNA_ID= /DNA_START= /DNA_END= /DNA_ORIENTATION=